MGPHLRVLGFAVLLLGVLDGSKSSAQVLSFDRVAYPDQVIAGFGTLADAYPASVNDSGTVAFSVQNTAGTCAVFTRTSAGFFSVVAFDGQIPAGASGFLDLCLKRGLVVINNAGDVVFEGRDGGPGGLDAIYRFDAGAATLSRIVAAGEASPRAPGSPLSAPILRDMNDSGQVLFQANDPSNGQGLWVWVPGLGLTAGRSILEGSGAPGGGTFSLIVNGSLNDIGYVAFSAAVTGGAAAHGIYRANFLTVIQLVDLNSNWEGGDPNIGNGFVFMLDPFMPPSYNDPDQLSFFAQTDGGYALGFFLHHLGAPRHTVKHVLELDPSILGEEFDCGLASRSPNRLDGSGNVVLGGCRTDPGGDRFGVFIFPWNSKIAMSGDALPAPLVGNFEVGVPFGEAHISQSGEWVTFDGTGQASSCTSPPCQGVFVAQLDLADTDGDGLLDQWELNGMDEDGDGTVEIPLNLAPFNADPNHKDLFVEIDFMDCALGGNCATTCTNVSHTHQPIAAGINNVIAAFANAPVANPDMATGINLHVDVDEAFAHACYLDFDATQPSPCSGTPASGSFEDIKCQLFGTSAQRAAPNAAAILFAMGKISRYGLFTHQKAAGDTSSGEAEVWGNDFYASLGDFQDGTDDQIEEEGALMHEFGHSLGLRHGGDDDVNWKPNYLSVMNYSFALAQYVGRGVPGNAGSGSFLDYSRWSLLPSPLSPCVSTSDELDASDLDEGCGIDNDDPPSAPSGFADWRTVYTVQTPQGCKLVDVPAVGDIDWNDDFTLTGVSLSTLNVVAPISDFLESWQMEADPDAVCGDEFPVLPGFNDWTGLRYSFYQSAGFSDGAPRGLLPPDEYQQPGDADSDSVYDAFDNCTDVVNPLQRDTDQDLEGDACDATPCGPGTTACPCNDGADNDLDTFTDYPNDPGCTSALSQREDPKCQDGVDNDTDTFIDFDGGASLNGGVPLTAPDPQCGSAGKNREKSGCGLGFELALLLPGLLAARRRRRGGLRNRDT